MLKIFLVGMGTGNTEHITMEGIKILKKSDLILLPKKNSKKEELFDIRKKICMSIIKNKSLIKEYKIPERLKSSSYYNSVSIWHKKISQNIMEIISEFEKKNLNLTFLIWGDSSLYDSTLRMISKMNINYELKIIPGVSSIQALISAHLISLNEIGESVLITTGRKLNDKMFIDNQRVIVLLDGKCSFKNLNVDNYYIWWGAYLGMKKEILVKGLLRDVIKKIITLRSKCQKINGWIMDTYLLKKIN